MWSVDDNLDMSSAFIGFYELDNIKNETIINAIKDILLRCPLNLEDYLDQTYDGANNMIGKRSGVSTKFLLKAMVTHCQGDCLSLAIKSLTKECTILRGVVKTVSQICVSVKCSPKRGKVLGSIVENIEEELEKSSRSDSKRFNKLSITRRAIRAKCFKKILDNDHALLELWEQSLK